MRLKSLLNGRIQGQKPKVKCERGNPIVTKCLLQLHLQKDLCWNPFIVVGFHRYGIFANKMEWQPWKWLCEPSYEDKGENEKRIINKYEKVGHKGHPLKIMKVTLSFLSLQRRH